MLVFVDAASQELAAIGSTEDAGRNSELRGPGWDALAELGVDVTLIGANLRLSPRDRIRNADAHRRFAAQVQARTVSATLQAALDRARLLEKIEALGGPDPGWPQELRDGARD